MEDGRSPMDTLNEKTEGVRKGLATLKEKIGNRTEELRDRLKDRDAFNGPSELLVKKKLEASLEDVLVASGIGLVGAGVVSLIVFRSRTPRAFLSGIGAGFGAGTAWSASKSNFAASSAVEEE